MSAYRNIKKPLCLKSQNGVISGKIIYPKGISGLMPIVISCCEDISKCKQMEKNFGVFFAQQGIAFYCFEIIQQNMEMSIETVINYFYRCKQIDIANIFLYGEGKLGMLLSVLSIEYKERIKGIMLDCPAECEFLDPTSLAEQDSDSDFLEYISQYDGPVTMIHNEGRSDSDLSFLNKVLGAYENSTMHIISKYENGIWGLSGKEMVRRIFVEFIQKNLHK